MSRKNARDVAMRMLYANDLGGAIGVEDLTFDIESQTGELDAEDKSYISSVVSGYSQNQKEIDSRIEHMSNGWKVSRIARVDLAILRLAVYELSFKEVPQSVVINEAVRLAKKYGAEKSGAFVNGVLGGVVRQPVDDPQ
jgi:transcription antitermination protein NusB